MKYDMKAANPLDIYIYIFIYRYRYSCTYRQTDKRDQPTNRLTHACIYTNTYTQIDGTIPLPVIARVLYKNRLSKMKQIH